MTEGYQGVYSSIMAIFLICEFLVALSIYAGVLTKQTVKLFSKTVLYSLIGNSMDNITIIYFIIHGL